MASCVLKYGDGIMPTIGAFHHAHLLTCYGASRPLYLYLHFRRRLGNPDASAHNHTSNGSSYSARGPVLNVTKLSQPDNGCGLGDTKSLAQQSQG